MNQGWGKQSGHQPFLSGFTLHSNSMYSVNKTAQHNRDALSRGRLRGIMPFILLCELKVEKKGFLNV